MNLTQISGSTAYIVSVIVLILFALPSFIGALKQAGPVRAILLFLTLGALIIGYEVLAVKTGLPYGKFSYGNVLVHRVFGAAPWIVAFSYPPVIVGSFWLARKMSVGLLVSLFTAIFTTLTFAVLAPVMTKLTIWHWETPGSFYGVHLRSFAGWFVCALIAGVIIKALWGEAEAKRLSAYSWFAIILFWAGANLGIGFLIPGLAGIAFAILLFVLFIIEKRRAQTGE